MSKRPFEDPTADDVFKLTPLFDDTEDHKLFRHTEYYVTLDGLFRNGRFKIETLAMMLKEPEDCRVLIGYYLKLQNGDYRYITIPLRWAEDWNIVKTIYQYSPFVLSYDWWKIHQIHKKHTNSLLMEIGINTTYHFRFIVQPQIFQTLDVSTQCEFYLLFRDDLSGYANSKDILDKSPPMELQSLMNLCCPVHQMKYWNSKYVMAPMFVDFIQTDLVLGEPPCPCNPQISLPFKDLNNQTIYWDGLRSQMEMIDVSNVAFVKFDIKVPDFKLYKWFFRANSMVHKVDRLTQIKIGNLLKEKMEIVKTRKFGVGRMGNISFHFQ